MSRGPYPILLMLAMSMPGAARAIGLGDIRVDSGLNEPLAARIDIVGASREELAALTASVANRDIFQRYGADRPAFLSSATFKVGTDGQGRPVLNIRSTEAFTDPVVSLLVDLRWGRNELVREYSLLLDPPDYATQRRAPDTQLASVMPTPSTPVMTPRRAITSNVPAAPEPSRDSNTNLAPSGQARHKVAAGETLRAVARRAGADNEANIQRMMIALFRANPNAFSGNINRLHSDAMLTIPTDAEWQGVSAVDAKREVRAQTMAWRLDGRQITPQRLVAAAPAVPALATTAAPAMAHAVAPAIVGDPDAALKARVQSLEQSLDAVHKQLASDDDKIQTLKQVAASNAASAAPATTPPITATAPSVAAPSAPTTALAELVRVPIIATAHAQTPSQAAASVATVAARAAATNRVTAPSIHTATNGATVKQPSHAGLIATVAVVLALLAGFAFFRRRVTGGKAPPVAIVPAESFSPPATAQAAPVPSLLAPTIAEAPKPMPSDEQISFPLTMQPAIAPTTVGSANMAKSAAMPLLNIDKTTVSLEIDIEALERSYLESLPPDISTIETMSLDRSSLDPSMLELDATTHHVQMPSALHNAGPAEADRRVSIVDVLKMAVDRDPNRSDLRMKLLETYYTVAATNQRAFVEAVRKLSRENDKLSPEEWNKVRMMGRQIAPNDILFSEPSEDADMTMRLAG